MKFFKFKHKLFFSTLFVVFFGFSSVAAMFGAVNNLPKGSGLEQTSLTSNKVNDGDGGEYFTIKSNKYDQIDINWNLSSHPEISKIDDQASLNIWVSEFNNPSINVIEYRVNDINEKIIGEAHFNNLKQDTSFNVNFALVVPSNSSGQMLYEYYQTIDTIAGFNFKIDLINLTADSVQLRWDYQIFDNNIVLNHLKLNGFKVDEKVIYATNNGFEQNSVVINDLSPQWTYNDWTLTINYDDNKDFVYQISDFSTPEVSAPELTIGDIKTLPARDGVRISYFLQSNGRNVISLQVNAPGATESIFFINNPLTNQENTFEVKGLNDEQTYTGWTINIVTDPGGVGDPISVPTFTVGVDNVITTPPSIIRKNLELVSNNSVKIEWAVKDLDGVTTNIKIVGTDINLSLGDDLGGGTVVENLKYNTTYSDWKLVVEYKNENNFIKTVDENFNSFSTIADPNNPINPDQNLWWVYLVVGLVVALIVALILVIYGWKKHQKNKNPQF